MKIQQNIRTEKGWKYTKNTETFEKSQFVIGFGKREIFEQVNVYNEIKELYPEANIVLCSSSGEILDNETKNDSIVLSAVVFEKTTIKTAKINSENKSSQEVGELLAKEFPLENLQHIFVLSEGSTINGTALIEGMNHIFGGKISITGGLAGDGTAFQKTIVGLNENPIPFQVTAVGFYGEGLKVGYGSYGGWEPFGAERTVTKSDNHILYELDDKPALELYKTYLGDKVAELPSSALLFPLSISQKDGSNTAVTRTILSIDEEKQSMTFAGDIPEGSKVQLMKSNHNKLIEGAETAAENSLKVMGEKDATLAILVSCVGRKLVLNQRLDEEVEAVKDTIGKNSSLIGFYSYGELAPNGKNSKCLLHNQTMTVTLLSE